MNVKYCKVPLLLCQKNWKLKNHEIKACSLSCALDFCHVNLVSLLPEMTNYAPRAQLIPQSK